MIFALSPLGTGETRIHPVRTTRKIMNTAVLETPSPEPGLPPERENIICFGDSITEGGGFSEGCRWTARVERHLEAIAPGRFRVWNRGQSGGTTGHALDRFDAHVEKYLPATVLIEFGFNDANIRPWRISNRCCLAAFKENLVEIVKLIRKGAGRPVLIVNHCIAAPRPNHIQGNGADFMENFQPYQAAIRAAAKRHAVPLIDLERTMQRDGVVLRDLLGEDELHVSESGQAIYAEFVLQGLLPILFCKKS